MPYTLSLTINRHFITGLIVGLILGSCLTAGGARLIKAFSKNGAERAPVAGQAATAPVPARSEIVVTDSDHIRGSKNAPVMLVVYSDFQCPYCGRHNSTMQNIIKKYGNKVAWVHRHFPLSFHENALPAAMASECASEQGKFWEFADKLFANQQNLNDGQYGIFAADLGLDANKFSSCYTSNKYRDRVNTDMQNGQGNGVEGTPATFVNGSLVSGAVPQSELEKMIDEKIASD